MVLVKDLVDAYPIAGRLGRIRGADATAGGADLVITELLLLEAVDAGVQFEVDLGAVADEEVLAGVGQALLLKRGEFLEEGLDVEDDAGADQVGTVRVNQPGRQEVEAGRVFMSMAGQFYQGVNRWTRTRRKRHWHCRHGQLASHNPIDSKTTLTRQSGPHYGRPQHERKLEPFGRECR